MRKRCLKIIFKIVPELIVTEIQNHFIVLKNKLETLLMMKCQRSTSIKRLLRIMLEIILKAYASKAYTDYRYLSLYYMLLYSYN